MDKYYILKEDRSFWGTIMPVADVDGEVMWHVFQTNEDCHMLSDSWESRFIEVPSLELVKIYQKGLEESPLFQTLHNISKK